MRTRGKGEPRAAITLEHTHTGAHAFQSLLSRSRARAHMCAYLLVLGIRKYAAEKILNNTQQISSESRCLHTDICAPNAHARTACAERNWFPDAIAGAPWR